MKAKICNKIEGVRHPFENVLHSKEYLQFLEDETTGILEPVYFSHDEGSGSSAFTPGYIQIKHHTYNPDMFFSGKVIKMLKKLGLVPERFLAMYTPFRMVSDISATDHRSAALLLDEIISYARGKKLQGVVFPAVMSEWMERILKERGFAGCPQMYTYCADIGYSSYDEYLTSLKRRYRKNLKNDLKAFLDSGAKAIKVDDLSGLEQTLFELNKNHMGKFGSDADMGIATFKRMSRLKCKSVLIAKKDDRVVGFALGIHDNETFHALKAVQEEDSDTNTYFGLGYVHILKEAISLGCKRMNFGLTMGHTKRLRGFSGKKLSMYALAFNPIHQAAIRYRAKRFSVPDELS